MLATPSIKERVAQRYAGISVRIQMHHLGQAAGTLFKELFDWLERHGGLEQAIHRAYSAMEPIPPERKTERIGLVVSRLLQEP